jgi:uncharacterized protein (DUF58 family)
MKRARTEAATLMKRSPKLVIYGAFAAVIFLLALALGRPELAALGAPFALVLVLGLAAPRPGLIDVALEPRRDRVLEGDEVEAELVVRASSTTPAFYLSLSLPEGVRLAEGETTFLLAPRAGEDRWVPLSLTCDRWGAYRLGDALWRASDAAGLRFLDARVRGRGSPGVPPNGTALVPGQTLGDATVRGQQGGSSPRRGHRVRRRAALHAWGPARRVNWRASSLHQTLHVNEQHPERNSDVVIFVDSFARRGTRTRARSI